MQQDGPSASLTAPNGSSQKRLIDAVRRAVGGGEGVPSLEAHGTGTALGDPIEVRVAARPRPAGQRRVERFLLAFALDPSRQVGAADRALSDACRDSAAGRQPKAHCTSLKSNMGHLEAAAAAAGLSSLVLTPLGAAEVAINA